MAIKVVAGYYLTRRQILQFAAHQNIDITDQHNPNLLNLYKLNLFVQQDLGFGPDVDIIPVVLLGGIPDPGATHGYLFTTHCRKYDDGTACWPHQLPTFEENADYCAIKDRIIEVGFGETRFINVTDPDEEHYVKDDFHVPGEWQD